MQNTDTVSYTVKVEGFNEFVMPPNQVEFIEIGQDQEVEITAEPHSGLGQSFHMAFRCDGRCGAVPVIIGK